MWSDSLLKSGMPGHFLTPQHGSSEVNELVSVKSSGRDSKVCALNKNRTRRFSGG